MSENSDNDEQKTGSGAQLSRSEPQLYHLTFQASVSSSVTWD